MKFKNFKTKKNLMPSNESLGSVDMYSPRRNAAILSLNFLFANPF